MKCYIYIPFMYITLAYCVFYRFLNFNMQERKEKKNLNVR